MKKLFVTAAVLSLSLSAAYASDNPFVGKWVDTGQLLTPLGTIVMETETVFKADGTYIATSKLQNGGMAQNSGTYKLLSDNMMRIDVKDYEPKRDPDGSKIVAPPGALGKYSFSDADTVILHEVQTGTTTVMHKVK